MYENNSLVFGSPVHCAGQGTRNPTNVDTDSIGLFFSKFIQSFVLIQKRSTDKKLQTTFIANRYTVDCKITIHNVDGVGNYHAQQ